MTLQELAALPVGTKVRLFVEACESKGAQYEYGVVNSSGVTMSITWDDDVRNLIDTKSQSWFHFVADMELA
jgi:hypothetical protein